MTSDNLLKFLGNREYMHQVSYQELKSMVVQYPYSLSLRYLLAMKSQQEDNTDLDRNIELLSTYGIDRSHLHRIFSEDPIVLEDLEESILMGEDFLELKELSALERDLGEKLVVNEVGALNFSQEEFQPANQDIPLSNPTTDLPPPIIGLSKDIESAKIETILADEISLAADIPNVIEVNQQEIPPLPVEEIKQSIPTEKEDIKLPEEVIESEEEEFITLDFEDEVTAEISEKAANETAPSAAFTANEIIEETDGLPLDAIEVNDLYISNNKSAITDLVDELFEEAEAEAVAEPAISDSAVFIEHPATVLEAESELIVEESIVTKVENIETAPESPSPPIEPQEITSNPPIPFEIEFSEADPVTIASIQEGTDIVLPEEEKTIPQEALVDNASPIIEINALVSDTAINEEEIENLEEVAGKTPAEAEMPASDIVDTQEIDSSKEVAEKTPVEVEVSVSNIVNTQEIVAEAPPKATIEKPSLEKEIATIPVKKTTFKFDSLDRLEASFNQSKKIIKPAPKAKFYSWQEQYADIGQLSSINLMPIINGRGKTIKKKRETARKKFAKTVAFAEESLEIDTALVSETLAQLLVRQGQYSKASAMYKQLCLIMPKKSGFFAGEIEKIQNLLDKDS